MAFPNIDINQIRATLKAAFDAQGHDADFVLYDGGTFTIPATEGFRGAQDLTEGNQQETHRLKVLAEDWDANSSRAPTKGDQVTFLGQRYGVQGRVRARGLQNDALMYVMEIRG